MERSRAKQPHGEATMTEKKTTANRKNALKSTGPKTDEGKQRSAMNAVKHGLRAVSLAVRPLESPEDWEAHRTLVVANLAPAGYLETILAERIAATLWRLGRVVRYESEVIGIAMREKEAGTSYKDDETLESLKDAVDYKERTLATLRRAYALKGKAHVSGEDALLVLDAVADLLGVDIYSEAASFTIPGVPDGPDDNPEDFTGWTRDLVDAGVQLIKDRAKDFNPAVDAWDLTLARAFHAVQEAKQRYEGRAYTVDKDLREALLPGEADLEKVTRYETTLERSFFRVLHELQRLQALRSGTAVPIPAVLDVDVAVSEAG